MPEGAWGVAWAALELARAAAPASGFGIEPSDEGQYALHADSTTSTRLRKHPLVARHAELRGLARASAKGAHATFADSWQAWVACGASPPGRPIGWRALCGCAAQHSAYSAQMEPAPRECELPHGRREECRRGSAVAAAGAGKPGQRGPMTACGPALRLGAAAAQRCLCGLQRFALLVAGAVTCAGRNNL